MLDRVNAIATVHRRLFQSDDVERFDVSAFVRDLVADVIGSSGRDDIEFSLDLERVDVAAAKAAPLALVISELLSNCMRHAFPDGRPGRIFVGIRRTDGDFRIEITDDGVGVSSTAKSSGFGLTIVQLLCQQLKAKSETTDAEPGTRVVINLPVNGAHPDVLGRGYDHGRATARCFDCRGRGASRRRAGVPARGGRLPLGGHAMSSDEAVALAHDLHPDLALVDVHLRDGPTGVEVARKIHDDCGAVALFMTANVKRLPDDFAGACGVIGKPYSEPWREDGPGISDPLHAPRPAPGPAAVGLVCRRPMPSAGA
jgi:anti-sigma regulatory factor (Ser/Thr protein kinase)